MYVNIPRDVVVLAIEAARSALLRPVTKGEAIQWCVQAQSEEAMKFAIEAIKMQAKAVTIAQTFVVVNSIIGENVELFEREGNWWLAVPGTCEGYNFGAVNEDMLFAELAKVRGSIH